MERSIERLREKERVRKRERKRARESERERKSFEEKAIRRERANTYAQSIDTNLFNRRIMYKFNQKSSRSHFSTLLSEASQR